MNEVNNTQPLVKAVTRTSSSVSTGSENKVSSDSWVSPQQAVEKPAVTEAVVHQAVAEINAYIQNEQRDLRFSVDDASGDVVVRVVDRETGDLIRQIPNEIVIDLAAKARDNEPFQLLNMYG